MTSDDAVAALPVAVAINPAAAFGARREVGPRVVSVLREAGFAVFALQETSFDALRESASQAVAGGIRALVVVGGDGMVSLGLNLLALSSIPLGIVPSGTGNDAARGLGIPVGDTDAAIRALLAALERPPRLVDAALIRRADGTDRWFLGVLSGGFDALVNERANRLRWPRGRHRYTRALLEALAGLTPIRYSLTLDGVETTSDGILVAIANLTSFGGGMRVAPDAQVDDGLFDVVMLEPVGRLRLLRIFPSVFSGAHVRNPLVSVQRATRVTLDAAGVVAYADGERVGPLPLTAEVVPTALAVLA